MFSEPLGPPKHKKHFCLHFSCFDQIFEQKTLETAEMLKVLIPIAYVKQKVSGGGVWKRTFFNISAVWSIFLKNKNWKLQKG